MAKHKRALNELALVISPILIIILLFVWFSLHTIAQNPNIDASIVNPIGFLISNFVYDGILNVENIVLSCAFLLAIFLFHPSFLRIRSALILPAIAIASGATAELAAVITCGTACSFYGMSGVAGGVIGFTFANFSVVFGLMFFPKPAGKTQNIADKTSENLLQKFTAIGLLVAYVFLLLLLSGFFAIHSTSTNNPFPVTIQVPVSIAGESQSVQVGHTFGLAFGFLLCLTLLISSLKQGLRYQNASQSS